ncbi:MAG: hypothetical protein ABUL44_01970 [Flavobacterium sp.]
MSTGYNFISIKNKPMRAFADEYNTSSNKMLDYLREKGVINIHNRPESDYEDWFNHVTTDKYKERYDLTPKGEQKVREMIQADGINYVKNRKVNGSNRKGNMPDDYRYKLA